MQNPPDDEDVVIDVDLYETKESTPYLLTSSYPTRRQKCCFWVRRGPAYLWGAVWGLLSFVLGCFCCRKTYDIISDDHVQRLFRDRWPYCHLLEPVERNEHSDYGLGLTRDECKQYQVVHVLDTLIMGAIKPFAEYRCAGVLAYFDAEYRLRIMIMNGRRILPPGALSSVSALSAKKDEKDAKQDKHDNQQVPHSNNNDDDSWDMAKLFMMQGAHYLIKFSAHPSVHFPQDAFIASFYKIFPETDALHQLLAPHLEFVLCINDSVLQGYGSILNAHYKTCCCWDAQTTNRIEIEELVRLGARRFRLPQPFGQVPDARFQPVYDTIYTFTRRVCQFYLPSDRQLARRFRKSALSNRRVVDQELRVRRKRLRQWCRVLNKYLQFGIERSQMEDPDVIAAILADFIFKVSLWHAADHYGLNAVENKFQPMSMRLDPDAKPHRLPRRGCCSWRKVVSVGDAFRHHMYANVFVRWRNNRCCYDTRLLTVKYAFSESRLQWYARHFVQDLRDAMRQVEDIMPSDQVAKSIEW